MKPVRIREPGVSLPFMLAMAAATAAGACESTPPAPRVLNSVRGYLAVAVGRSAKAEAGGLFSRTIKDQNIYLPGVAVYLENSQANMRTDTVQTDLSGRFTLYAPDKGKYRICW